MKKQYVMVIIAITAVFLSGCSSDPISKVPGAWKSSNGGLIDFSPDGKAMISLPYSIPNRDQLPSRVDGVIIDLGFWVVSYSPAIFSKALIREKDSEYTVRAAFSNVDTASDIPVAKILLSTDREGNCAIWKSIDGKALDGFKVHNPGRVKFRLETGETPTVIDQVSFKAETIDLKLNWKGTLSIAASWRASGRDTLEVTLPLIEGDPSREMVLFDAQVRNDLMRVTWRSLNIDPEEYRQPKAGDRTYEVSPRAFILDPSRIEGILVSENPDIAVNTGVTVDRLQNIRFRLPGKDIAGYFTETELQGLQMMPPLTVTEGAN